MTGFVHFTFPSTRLRHFSFAEDREKWGDSLTRCKQKNESAVTLYDDEDAKFTANFTYTETVWLGLRKVRNITWSNGRPFTFNKSSVDVTNGTQRCQAIERNTWKDYNCSRLEYFMCELFWGKFDFFSFLFHVAKFYRKKWHWTKQKSNRQNNNQKPCLEGLRGYVLSLILTYQW